MAAHVAITHHTTPARIGRHHSPDTRIGTKVDSELQAVRL